MKKNNILKFPFIKPFFEKKTSIGPELLVCISLILCFITLLRNIMVGVANVAILGVNCQKCLLGLGIDENR